MSVFFVKVILKQLSISSSHDPYIQLFWKHFKEWLSSKTTDMQDIDHNGIIFGVLLKDNKLHLVVNVLIILFTRPSF